MENEAMSQGVGGPLEGKGREMALTYSTQKQTHLGDTLLLGHWEPFLGF